ncbi:hypothetical protein PC116_g23474 [Phytophthora cactorum]|uniref:Uncharacterized protein n=1 Tax=Phytophthora cactorum TaxID=29920 RepID=A0A8T1JUP2_9STRA|nr:hypothetical protein Pcac1_g18948 [Phytophthora cactorum]KAG2882022.1 hypothetical protein PC114_g21242 [Phytophthora cactorum]KAG2904326.1 hypothetical protein PC117_g21065 [Phytophthora cactorum]KAG2982682.1 hypothetical protein PC119_g20785 [Phytophthora cactorum]KAG3001214.1 hypothetical protein PC120_g20398 [Phytophthora cactorum]
MDDANPRGQLCSNNEIRIGFRSLGAWVAVRRDCCHMNSVQLLDE